MMKMHKRCATRRRALRQCVPRPLRRQQGRHLTFVNLQPRRRLPHDRRRAFCRRRHQRRRSPPFHRQKHQRQRLPPSHQQQRQPHRSKVPLRPHPLLQPLLYPLYRRSHQRRTRRNWRRSSVLRGSRNSSAIFCMPAKVKASPRNYATSRSRWITLSMARLTSNSFAATRFATCGDGRAGATPC